MARYEITDRQGAVYINSAIYTVPCLLLFLHINGKIK